MAGQYNVALPSPKPTKGKQTVTKIGKQTYISNQPYYETKEGKKVLQQINKDIPKK